MSEKAPKIIQIIPAIGWQAIYETDDASGYECVDLVGWGLDSNGNVVALATDTDGYVDEAHSVSNFVGIKSINDHGDLVHFKLNEHRTIRELKRKAAKA